MKRLFSRTWQRLALGLALVALPVSVAAASNVANNPRYVYVPEDQVIDGNYYNAGDTVDVRGTVNGDVIVAGGVVNISGAVAGDVIAAGGRVRISGPVQGDVRAAGGDITIESVVGKNVTLAGGNITFTKTSAVGWEAMVFAGMLDLQGRVTKDLRGAVGAATLNSPIGRDVWLKVSEPNKFVLAPNANIGGDLRYMSPTMAEVLSGATIKGEVQPHLYTRPDRNLRKAAVYGFLAFKLLLVLALWIVGLVLLWLAPKAFERCLRSAEKQTGPAFGWGALLLFATPIVVAVLAVSVVGLPLAIIVGAAYICYLIIGYVLAGLYLGERIIRQFSKRPWHVSMNWAMVLGVAILVAFTWVPVIGVLVKLAAMSFGAGSLILFKSEELKKWR